MLRLIPFQKSVHFFKLYLLFSYILEIIYYFENSARSLGTTPEAHCWSPGENTCSQDPSSSQRDSGFPPPGGPWLIIASKPRPPALSASGFLALAPPHYHLHTITSCTTVPPIATGGKGDKDS